MVGSNPDVVIIGGGVIGLSIARALALRGVRNLIVIERAMLGKEATTAAAGILAPQAEADAADDFFSLACRSRDMYPDFADKLREETGIDVELDRTGTIYVALSQADDNELELRYRWQTRAGLEVQKLSGDETHLFEPCISEAATLALRFPKDMQVENRRLLAALIESNRRLGVGLWLGTTVNQITTDVDKISGLQTSRGPISTPLVVLAAGAWTSSIPLASRALPNVGVVPVRGQMICLRSSPPLTRHVIYSSRGYIVPRMDGRLLVGSTSEPVGFDKRVTASGVQRILKNALEISPGVADLQVTESWAGLRPKAADGLPVLGPCAEINGLFYATGHYRNGILLAPITGELLSEAIVSKTSSPLIEAFTPNRFEVVPAI
jgi:glycine oxidase